MDGFGNEGRADGELHPGAGTGHEPEKAERPEASRQRRKGVDEHVEEHREGEHAAPPEVVGEGPAEQGAEHVGGDIERGDRSDVFDRQMQVGHHERDRQRPYVDHVAVEEPTGAGKQDNPPAVFRRPRGLRGRIGGRCDHGFHAFLPFAAITGGVDRPSADGLPEYCIAGHQLPARRPRPGVRRDARQGDTSMRRDPWSPLHLRR